MIGPALYSSDRPDWGTPRDLFDRLHAVHGFQLDACAHAGNAKLPHYFDEAANGLAQSWAPGPVWLNPPYGREIGKWVKKAAEEASRGVRVVALLPARTDARWFQSHVLPFADLKLLPGRLRFEVDGQPGGPAPFPSILAVYRTGKPMPKLEIETTKTITITVCSGGLYALSEDAAPASFSASAASVLYSVAAALGVELHQPARKPRSDKGTTRANKAQEVIPGAFA